MDLALKRIILFSADIERLASFYRDIIGLVEAGREDGWIDFAAGGCHLALHAGPSKPGNRPPKLVFYAADVAATRNLLARRGLAGLGPVKSTGSFDMCDGRDPDGNPIQISSRR